MPWSTGCGFQFKHCGGKKKTIQFLGIWGWDQAEPPTTGWSR